MKEFITHLSTVLFFQDMKTTYVLSFLLLCASYSQAQLVIGGRPVTPLPVENTPAKGGIQPTSPVGTTKGETSATVLNGGKGQTTPINTPTTTTNPGRGEVVGTPLSGNVVKGNTSPVNTPKPVLVTLPGTDGKPIETQPVVTHNAEGNASTNWTEGYIEAVGKCFIDRQKFNLPGQAEELAKTGAEVVARRNLLIQIQQVRILDTVTLVNQVFDRQVTLQILDGYVRNAYRVGDFKVTDSYVEVVMRMPLHGGQNSVAEAASQSIRAAMANGKIAIDNPNPYTTANQQQVLQAMAEAGVNAQNPLMLNVQNNGGQPSLYPTINFVDENGQVIKLNPLQYLPQNGLAQATPYLQLSKEVLAQMGSNGQNILNGILNPDGSITINTKDQLKGTKFLAVLKKIGSVALSALPWVVSLIH